MHTHPVRHTAPLPGTEPGTRHPHTPRLKTRLTLAIGALSVAVVAAGTLGLVGSLGPAPEAATVTEPPPLERSVTASEPERAIPPLTASVQ